MKPTDAAPAVTCPAPLPAETIQMAHGGGGRRTRQLLERIVLPAFDQGHLAGRLDSAIVSLPPGRIAMTTDSYVVTPLFFPGGDIGKLAVCGTTNDLAVVGAHPRYLSVGFILEEGLPLVDFERIVFSMRDAAKLAGVELVTGDTKVVDRGHGHGLYVNTTGIGVVAEGTQLGLAHVAPGDAVLVSGDLGRHGVAILSVRAGLSFETTLESDVAPLWPPIAALLAAGLRVKVMRDLTRGGLATALNEIALDANVGITIDEAAVPVQEAVAGACELLGLDPLYVANEGRFLVIVHPDDAGAALAEMRRFPDSVSAATIGHVVDRDAGGGHVAPVLSRTALGPERVLDLLSGEQLPRIC